MIVRHLGQLPYQQAWDLQETAHTALLAGGPEQILLVEHPPVITYGRRPGVSQHLLATPEELSRRAVEIVQSDRGGDITFHGPGQIVAYPIIRLADHGFTVGVYVHTLEAAVVAMLAELGIEAFVDPAAVGVWTRDQDAHAKVCAIGVRIRRGASLHGLALNVNPDLTFFDLIVPCGLAGRRVTSLARVLGSRCPDLPTARDLLARHLISALDRAPAPPPPTPAR